MTPTRRHVFLLTLMAAPALAILVVPPASASCGWTARSSPAVAGGLQDVNALSAKNVWAVGRSNKGALVEHWNGAKWSVFGSPHGGSMGILSGVDALSKHDVWAVGSKTNSTTFAIHPLVEHWNGTRWSTASAPSVGKYSQLVAVSGASADDVWAVGSQNNHTLTEHWNGSKWKVIASLGLGSLDDVLALGASNVWAVGENGNGPKTLIEHWNGSKWRIASSTSRGAPSATQDRLVGVTALSRKNLWAVGGGAPGPLTQHWTGSGWKTVKSAGRSGDVLSEVAGASSSSVWAVGSRGFGAGQRTFAEHWNGSRWSVAVIPNGSGPSGLNAVTRVPRSSQLWTVGQQGTRPLIERHC